MTAVPILHTEASVRGSGKFRGTIQAAEKQTLKRAEEKEVVPTAGLVTKSGSLYFKRKKGEAGEGSRVQ